jgi:large subunit ribosomal protein L13
MIDMTVINAEKCVAGRLASLVAKRLLKGEEIVIINAEKAIITGNPKAAETFFRGKISRGDPYHGPFYPKQPERILRRIIRGMLPHHKPRGRTAYGRLKVYRSVPASYESGEAETVSAAKRKITCKSVSIENLSRKFGA